MPVIEIDEIFVAEEQDGDHYVGGVDVPQAAQTADLCVLSRVPNVLDMGRQDQC